MDRVKRLVESRSPNDELAAAFVENRKAELKDRIVPYMLRFKANGEPDFPCDKNSVLGRAENEGMQNMRRLAMMGHNYVVWASPELGRSVYKDGSRVVVAIVTGRFQEVTMECRGIVLKNESPEELLEMVRKLQEKGAVVMDEIRNLEDLREQALAVDVKSEGELWDMMEKAFGNSEIWEEIRNSKDQLTKHLAEEMIARFRNSPESEVAKRGGDIWWGAQLEMFMARNGFQIMGGNHGVSNTSLLGTMSPFNSLFSMAPVVSSESLDSRLERCNGCGNFFIKKKKQCPKCKG
ncbi:hypothetical protein HYV64_04990 [Candidatus Shapirobacteria bacterium]|nr:hypothetical protein [Candidatus Shapirobacteria bacterium]